MTIFARVCAALALVGMVVATAGCAAPEHRHASATAPATSPASASASAPALATTLPSGSLADGDCEHVLDSATLELALGTSQKATVTTADPVLAAAGGISCDYQFGPNATAIQVSVDVAPSAIADPAEITASLAPPSCGLANQGVGGAPCTATGAVAGWWYNLSELTPNVTSIKTQLSSFSTITADLKEALKTIAAPQHAQIVRPFVLPFHCDSADGVGAQVAPSHNFLGETDFPGEVAVAANLLDGGPATCSVGAAQDNEWDLTIYAGGASVYTQCAHSSTSRSTTVSVPGVAAAFSLPQSSGDGPQICATDGTSTVSAVDENNDDNSAWTKSELAGLGTLLVPVFTRVAHVTADWTASIAGSSVPHAVAPLAAGDCTKLLNTNTVAAALQASTHADVTVVDPVLATVGGADCDYSFPSLQGDGRFELEVEVAPSAIADPNWRKASLASPACGPDPNSDDGVSALCTETADVAGWWYSITLADPEGGDLAAVPAISAALEHVLSATVAPQSLAVTKPFECPATDAAGSPLTRSRIMPDEYYSNDGVNFSQDDEIQAAAFLLAGPVTCAITRSYGEQWPLTVYPGSSSAYFECTHGSTGTFKSVPGVTSAFTFQVDGDQVCATDGTSTITVLDEEDDVIDPWTTATLKTLSSLLVPVFAAAS